MPACLCENTAFSCSCGVWSSNKRERICWPFSFDQPLNAIHLTENLDVAYELFQVRTGPGLNPVYRLEKAPEGTVEAVREEARSVLQNAFGEDGSCKRANMNVLREKTLDAWSKQGSSTREIETFLESL